MTEVNASAAQYSFTVAGQVFQVLHFSAYEEISQLSRYSLTLWSDDPAVDIASLIRQDADIKVAWAGKEKHFYGIVSSLSQTGAGRPGLGGVEQEWGEYTVEVVPTLWLLNQKTNCRIFQEMTTDAIIKKVLDERGMAGKYSPRLAACPKREYCVQYRETDYAFISRLMEEEGVFFYFTHDGKELMVLGDSAGHFDSCQPDADVKFKSGSGGLAAGEEYVSSLTYTEAATIGKIVFKDHDYRKPTQALKVEKTAAKNTDLEIYDYHPERYTDEGRGRQLAAILQDAESCWAKVISVDGTWRSASAGGKLTLARAYRSDLDGEWVITSMTHTASQRADTGVEYATSFYAIPAQVTFRQFPSTPKPVLNPQTATVVGPGEYKIHMDTLGRAKVQFHWDREGKMDNHSSCWIRVAQPFAGMDRETHQKHGFQWHPQVGDEVVVDFLEGDADKPLIVGSVYNADNQPLVKLEELIRQMILTRYQHRLLMDDANRSVILNTGGNQTLQQVDKDQGRGQIILGTSGEETLEMEDGSDYYGNQIRLATADKHQLLMAEKDTRRGIALQTRNGNQLVLNDNNDEVTLATTKGNYVSLDQPNENITIQTAGKRKIVVDDRHETIQLVGRDDTQITILDGRQKILIESGNHHTRLEMDYGKDRIHLQSQGGNITVEAGGTLTLHGGDVKIKADRKLTVEAGDEIKVETKKAVVETAVEIDLKSNNVEIEGSGKVKVQAGANLTLKAGAKTSVSGAMVDVSADGFTTVSGSVVKIN